MKYETFVESVSCRSSQSALQRTVLETADTKKSLHHCY